MPKATARRTITCVLAVEVEVVGAVPAKEVGEALIGRVEIPESFHNFVHGTTIHTKAIGLLDCHEGVPLEGD